jgi:hypothetical protein
MGEITTGAASLTFTADGRLSAWALRPGDVIVVELYHPVSPMNAAKIKAVVMESFPGHDVMLVEGRFKAYRPVEEPKPEPASIPYHVHMDDGKPMHGF